MQTSALPDVGAASAHPPTRDVPKSGLLYFLLLVDLAYLIIAVHTPFTLYAGAPHDDTLFIDLGRNLADGKWLGTFGQYTLMKGPGYPAFLALSNWLGISASLGQALLHCLAVTVFTLICHRYIKSTLISVLLFLLLLWQPIALSAPLHRILRENIYYAQTLLVVALFAIALFPTRETRSRLIYAVLAGLTLGWLWLTREEGAWVIPGLGVLFLAACLHAFRARRVHQLVVVSLVAGGVFVVTQAGFRTLNWWHYGKFVGVDVKENSFQKALRAIHSVRSGGIMPFVEVTRAARQHIYRVSPTFASLSFYFDPPNEPPPTTDTLGWTGFTCRALPHACGEIGAGWFLWALRDAASQRGRYASPAIASAFFGQMAHEINAACERGELECHPQLLAELPPVVWRDVLRVLPAHMWTAVAGVFQLTRAPQTGFAPSIAYEAQLASILHFLNYPKFIPPTALQEQAAYTINGWYYRAGDEWISLQVTSSDGVTALGRAERRASPDIQLATKDSAAASQRFTLHTRCGDRCLLVAETATGAKVSRDLGELQKGLVVLKIGDASLAIEGVQKQANPNFTPTRIDELSNRIRIAIITHYHYLMFPITALGLLMFLAASLRCWRRAPFNVCYVLALTCWTLVSMRLGLIALIDATSFQVGFSPGYLAPAFFLIAAGSVLSIAAGAQLFSRSSATA